MEKDSEMLNKLKENKNMHPCGSRWFAEKYSSVYITDDTDYDFYCLNSKENEKFLKSMGMIKSDWSDVKYCDDLAVGVYKSKCGQLEVALRTDVEKYKLAISLISEEYYTKYLHKSSPIFIGQCEFIRDHFNLLFRIAELQMVTVKDDFDFTPFPSLF